MVDLRWRFWTCDIESKVGPWSSRCRCTNTNHFCGVCLAYANFWITTKELATGSSWIAKTMTLYFHAFLSWHIIVSRILLVQISAILFQPLDIFQTHLNHRPSLKKYCQRSSEQNLPCSLGNIRRRWNPTPSPGFIEIGCKYIYIYLKTGICPGWISLEVWVGWMFWRE